jgi:cytochrome c oxidase subunit 1
MTETGHATTLIKAHLWVAFIAFLAAAVLGFYQVLERSGLIPALESHVFYYGSVTAHGVLMAFVLTTFFIMGFGYYLATTSLRQPVWAQRLAWVGFWVSLLGTVMAAIPILIGKASVMYTFYPPLQAHPLFYIGAALLIVGSLFWGLIMIVMMAQWKRANPGRPVPLAMFAMVANVWLWLWTVVGVVAEVVFQLIPWSLGWVDTVDAGLARTLFAWTLHPIVYFWLIPAYITLYTLMPRAAGGRVFSDEWARLAFIALLLFSLPVGFHHLYMDPEQAAGWKFLHGAFTFGVMVPTLMTGFSVIASLEMAGRLRGGRGLFGWIGKIPWREPLVLATGLALLMLILGGFGGAINASYAMNTVVHNTHWVTAHFHLILGGVTLILYMATAYHLWPKLTGKQLYSRGMANTQLLLWFLGMVVTTTPWHIVGFLGEPRRTAYITYGTPIAEQWAPYHAAMVVGAALLLLSAILFVYGLFRTHGNPAAETNLAAEYAEPRTPVLSLPGPLNGFALWNWLLLILMGVSFGYPILQFFLMQTYGAPGWGV